MKKALEVVVKDFGKASKVAFMALDCRERNRLERWNQITERAYFGYQDFYKNGIVWYGGDEGPSRKSLGKPEDYIKIRDDYGKLKKFLSKLLGKGKVSAGTNRFDSITETRTSDYAIWLYKFSEHKPFKKNFQKAITELLTKELNRRFKKYSYEKGMETALRHFKNVYKKDLYRIFYDESLESSMQRQGIDDCKDKKFVRLYKRELKKTIKKDERGFEKTNFRKTSKEFKEKFKEFYLDKEAKHWAMWDFRPQFGRLLELFKVVYHIGRPTFANLEPILKEKVDQKWYEDAPTLTPFVYYQSLSNINASLRLAYDSVKEEEKCQRTCTVCAIPSQRQT